MVGNTAEEIFSYMPVDKMMNVAPINIGIGNRVQDAYNSRQRYHLLSLRRLQKYINVMQGATRQYSVTWPTNVKSKGS